MYDPARLMTSATRPVASIRANEKRSGGLLLCPAPYAAVSTVSRLSGARRRAGDGGGSAAALALPSPCSSGSSVARPASQATAGTAGSRCARAMTGLGRAEAPGVSTTTEGPGAQGRGAASCAALRAQPLPDVVALARGGGSSAASRSSSSRAISYACRSSSGESPTRAVTCHVRPSRFRAMRTSPRSESRAVS